MARSARWLPVTLWLVVMAVVGAGSFGIGKFFGFYQGASQYQRYITERLGRQVLLSTSPERATMVKTGLSHEARQSLDEREKTYGPVKSCDLARFEGNGSKCMVSYSVARMKATREEALFEIRSRGFVDHIAWDD